MERFVIAHNEHVERAQRQHFTAMRFSRFLQIAICCEIDNMKFRI